jgi:hypothetical protein
MDLHGHNQESLLGSPQGGLVSPILANVYLHELDEYVEQLRKTYEKGTRKRDNPAWVRLIREKNRLLKWGATKTKAFKTLMKQLRATPSKLVNDSAYGRLKYLRYADDWLIGKGPLPCGVYILMGISPAGPGISRSSTWATGSDSPRTASIALSISRAWTTVILGV